MDWFPYELLPRVRLLATRQYTELLPSVKALFLRTGSTLDSPQTPGIVSLSAYFGISS